MRAYLAILSARCRMLLQYRAAALAGCGTQLFWGLIRMMIFDAFYRSTTLPQPMTRSQIITYVWLGQAMLGLLPWSMDGEIRSMIRTGAVAYELARPLDLYLLWYSRAISNRIAPTTLRAIPLFLIAGTFFGLQRPPSLASALGWAVSTAGAVLLGSAITTLVHTTMLWTLSGEGVSRFVPTLVYAFSGMLVPLPLLPHWVQIIIQCLPFRDLVDVPFRVYMGHIPPAALLPVLGQQLAWIVGLILTGRILMARGIRRLVVQGG